MTIFLFDAQFQCLGNKMETSNKNIKNVKIGDSASFYYTLKNPLIPVIVVMNTSGLLTNGERASLELNKFI